jgi:hypothetical protein
MNANQQQARVELEQPLFTATELAKAMKLDTSITEHHAEIYLAGIERQAAGDTVTAMQAKAIGITHKKIAKAIDAGSTNIMSAQPADVPSSNAERIDVHLGNIIANLQALKDLFKEMQ